MTPSFWGNEIVYSFRYMSKNVSGVNGIATTFCKRLLQCVTILAKKYCNIEIIDNCSEIFVSVDTKFYS